MDLDSLVSTINNRNNNKVFDTILLQKAYDYLTQSFGSINFLDHGGHMLCFESHNSLSVIKLCQKRADIEAIKSWADFRYRADMLSNNGIPIANYVDFLYEDEYSFAFTQIRCVPLDLTDISLSITCKIANILCQMLLKGCLLPDLFLHNFGLGRGPQVILYDFHDNIVTDESQCDLLKKSLCKIVPSAILASKFIKIIDTIKGNPCKTLLPLALEWQFEAIKNSCISFSDYQYLQLRDANLQLSKHTLVKFEFVKQFLLSRAADFKADSLLDAGCSLGGIGLKTALEFQIYNLTLNNVTTLELRIAKKVAQECLMTHCTTFCNRDIMKIDGQWSITMYFALIHHLLRAYSIDEILGKIALQTKQYCFIEVPFKGDHLLSLLPLNSRYNCLDSVSIFIEKLNDFFIVEQVAKIDYEDHKLNRFAFALRISNE